MSENPGRAENREKKQPEIKGAFRRLARKRFFSQRA
jgi:hypothetical protein